MVNEQPPFVTTYVFDADEDDEVTQASVAKDEQPKRARPGRPKGSLGRVTEETEVTLSDFAYMRAIVQGIDANKAALRYLSGKQHLSSKACSEYESRLRARLQRTIKVLYDEAQQDQANAQLDVIKAPMIQGIALGPSLEQFAARFDSDMYSERELQELYEDEYGPALQHDHQPEGPGIGYGIKAKLNAINWLASRIAKTPNPFDPIEHWLDLGLAMKLRAHGIITLENLTSWVNLQGRTFYHRLRGFGVTRARRLVLWLMDNEDFIGVRLNRRIRFQQVNPDLAIDSKDLAIIEDVTPITVYEYRIVPYERFAWPTHLQGQDGTFRNRQPNTLGATNDKMAVDLWFANLKEKASPATVKSYLRAVELLLLWALVEKRTPLSSLVTSHFHDFREFLRHPPPHWCCKMPTVRSSPDWTPLRGAMKEDNIQHTFSAIASLFSSLASSGYLVANAISSARTSLKRDQRMDVMRSFSEQDLEAIKRTMDDIEDGPNKRRLRAIILLLQTGGFRRGEAINLRYRNLDLLRQDNRTTNVWVATFNGKGGKQRKVPIKPETYEALQAHYQDRVQLTSTISEKIVNGKAVAVPGPLAKYKGLPFEDTPLLSILNDKFADGRESTLGETSGNARVRENVDGALSYGRIHSILKDFMHKVSQRDDLVSGHANFLKASAHWMRHTFGIQAVIASKGDLPAIQQILGHADLTTTGIYMKADMSARLAVIDGIKGAV